MGSCYEKAVLARPSFFANTSEYLRETITFLRTLMIMVIFPFLSLLLIHLFYEIECILVAVFYCCYYQALSTSDV